MSKSEILTQILYYLSNDFIIQFLTLLKKPEVYQSIESSFTEEDFVLIKIVLDRALSRNTYLTLVFIDMGYNQSLIGLEGAVHLWAILLKLNSFNVNLFFTDLVLLDVLISTMHWTTWTTIYVSSAVGVLVVVNLIISILS